MLSDFPAWTSAFTSKSVFVYLRYTISNSQVGYSTNWIAYSFAHPISTSYYY